MQATSTSPFLAHLSPEALQANQAMLARQAKQMARQAEARQNLEQTIRDMEFREKKQKQVKHTQAINIAQAKRKRITRTKADDAFSLCVRLRANCTCERCGEQFPHNAMKHLHCSHNYSREYQQVRFHPDNAFALCKDCHRWFANAKLESTAWKNEMLGEERLRRTFQALQQSPQKISKAEEARIAAYYRIVARYLLTEREKGNTTYLSFKGYEG